jgi:glyoxylase-like metal-dependent hydrolase (beta-lactamase superfamily II)
MRLGPWRVREVTDGSFALDGGAMFGVVPKVLWERAHAADSQNRIRLSLRCLLVEGAGRKILLDAGIGERWSEKELRIYAIDHGAGALARSLGALGVAAEDITDVVLSHLHFDHAGGLVRRDDGRLALAFPSARVHTQRAHWEWARSPTERDRASFRAEDFGLLAGSPLLVLHEGDVEIYPGLEIRAGSGHTVGHQMVVVQGDGEGLVFTGDTIPTAAHLKIPYVMGYDLFPLTTMEEKKRLLAEVCDRGWVLAFDHEPAFAACRLRRTERGDYAVAERVFL